MLTFFVADRSKTVRTKQEILSDFSRAPASTNHRLKSLELSFQVFLQFTENDIILGLGLFQIR